MKQILQDVNSGELTLEEVPPPALMPKSVRVRTGASLVSAGTEKYIMDLAQKSLLGKAWARPDLARQVVSKARKEGLWNTFRNAMTKLDEPMPLGYSAAGVVESVADEVAGFKTGDRVAVAGAGYANHAEINNVPRNLVARLPDGVSFQEAAYTTVASIALQGVRLAQPQLGEHAVVSGLGLVGLLVVQLLKANGCRVFGIDVDERAVARAREMGLDDGAALGEGNAVQAVEQFTRGRGADHVLIAAATDSSQPVELAGEVARRKGQIVAIGNVGMDVPRDVYYEKELELKVSMSYGPGRYDPSYEEGGIDYPYDYVRWTEQRNMEAVLDLMAAGKLDVEALTTHRFPFADAEQAYGLVQEGGEPFVGVLFEYDIDKTQAPVVRLEEPAQPRAATEELSVGFAGAGNYAALHLIPRVQKHEHVRLAGLVTATGLNARKQAGKFGFSYCTTDFEELAADEAVDAVFIATRHSTHAGYTARALEAGKHVFVEKPMVATENELAAVIEAYERANAERPTAVMVGLNRRFAPMVTRLKEAFPGRGAKQMIYRVNAGTVPEWWHKSEEGGGALVGEMCHFIDLMQHIAGERPTEVFAHALALDDERNADHDNLVVNVAFGGGSAGTLCYNTVGDKATSKERIEVYGEGAVATLDDFRRLEVTRGGKTQRKKARNQDKGQPEEVEQTLETFRSGQPSPIPFEELVAGMQAVFAARRSLTTNQPVALDALDALARGAAATEPSS